jgi:hypothetical protein
MADAVLEGMALRKETMDEEVTDLDRYAYEDFDGMEDVADEALLGESTLAKIRRVEIDSEDSVEDIEALAAYEFEDGNSDGSNE